MAEDEKKDIEEQEETKDKKQAKKVLKKKDRKPFKFTPVHFYIIIFLVSFAVTFFISTMLFENIQTQQNKFLEILKASGLVDSTLADSVNTSYKPEAVVAGVESDSATVQDSMLVSDSALVDSALIAEENVPDTTRDIIVTEAEKDADIFEGIVDTVDNPYPFEEVMKHAKNKEAFIVQKETDQETPPSPRNVNISKTLKILKSMKTDQKVNLLRNFDNDTFAKLLMQMKERNAAKILANLPTERAFTLTQLILNKRD